MGSVCTKNSSVNVTSPNNYFQVLMTNQLSHLLSLESQNNINHRYAHQFILDKNVSAGEGIKKTVGYKSLISNEDLIKQRREFWETRTEGNKQAWEAIKICCETDEGNANAILKASGLYCTKNSIQIVFDEQSSSYEVPIFCINNPYEYQVQEKNSRRETIQESDLKLKLRCSSFLKDLDISIKNTETIEQLKKAFLKQALISEDSISFIRFFYNGKELNQSEMLIDHNVVDDQILQVFMMKKTE